MYLSDIEHDVPLTPEQEQQPKRRRKLVWLALPVVGLALFAAKGVFFGPGQAAPPPLPVVTVSTPLRQTINEWDDYTGRFEASRAVEIKPRVSGQLQSIHFRDGDVVRQGQLLFVIDPRPFTAAYAEAKAREASAGTALGLARSELARASRLINDQAVSKEEIDTLRAAVRSAEASLAAAQAQVRSRALDVEFTQVRAPITGRVSDRRIDAGNLVSGGSDAGATLLTTIYALDPIYFRFDGSEALYLKQLRDRDKGPKQVQIRLQDEPDYRWNGKVDFTDNAIDQGSGTIRGRAVIANPAFFLTPGMFGNMRLGNGSPHAAMLVPDAAVQTDIGRKAVLVVDKDGNVTTKPVQVGPLVNGLRVIKSGLAANDHVVIEGVQFAAPGTKVTPQNGKILAVKPTPASTALTTPVASQATIASR